MQRLSLQSVALALFALFLTGTAAVAQTEKLPPRVCLESLDTLLEAGQSTPGANEKLRDELEKLATSCPEIPHIQHNLAVLHANEQDWATAIEYFQKSLILDERARQSHEALARIHRFQAVLAYREALQSNSPEPAAPSFDLQSSRIKNFHLESIRDKTETTESLREALNPLLENWWRQTVLDKRNCPDCFTDSYAEIRERPVSDEKSDNTTLPETSPPLPDYLIVPAADDVLAIIRNPADRVYTLRILQTAAGWRIDDELLL